MKVYLIPIILMLFDVSAYCKSINLSDMLDRYIPNVFVRWSGTVVKRSWKNVLKYELFSIINLSDLDKKFGKRYSYTKHQDCEFGIDPSTDFKKSSIGILTDLNIYKTPKTVGRFFTKEQLLVNKNSLNALINGNASLEVIQLGCCHLKHDNSNVITANIVFKSLYNYYSIIIEMLLSGFNGKAVIKSINVTTKLPLNVSNKNITQILQLRVDYVRKLH